jgi:hypothetical protein
VFSGGSNTGAVRETGCVSIKEFIAWMIPMGRGALKETFSGWGAAL